MAVVLVLPLLAFIVVTFIVPLGTMFWRSVYDGEIATALPNTVQALSAWDQSALPDETTFATLGREIAEARADRTLGRVASRLNRIQSGMRSLLSKTGRRLREVPNEGYREAMLAIDSRWEELDTWRAIRTGGQSLSGRNYLQALDLEVKPDGQIGRVTESRRIYLTLLGRTLGVSISVTVLCMILGYPIAYTIAHATPRTATFLLILVLVPFWTSLLVRTTSWIVLLQQQGVLNDLLVWLGLVDDSERLKLVYNMTGTLIAMTQVLLPFMVLPLYAVMRSIQPTYTSAALSLGANPLQAFVRVYWPQSLPGVAAGSLLVFILAIGYYITPALVGGTSGQLISNMIAYHIESSLNWGLAAALSVIVLISVFALYVVYDRVIGIDRMKLG